MGLLPRSAVVVVEVVGERRTTQCHHGDRPGVQNGPDSRVAPPRPRAHGSNHKSPQVVGHPVCLA